MEQASPPLSPAHIADADPEEDPEEDPGDHLADGGDDDDEPSEDDADDEDEEEASEEEDDDEEEEHLAPADSSAVPVDDPVASAEDTEALEMDESAPTPSPPRSRRAGISVRLPSPMAASMEARIAEYATAPTSRSPPPSPLTPLSSPRIRLKAASPSTYHPSEIPSPPLLLPSTSHREDIPKANVLPQKRLCLTSPTSMFKIKESSVVVAARQPGFSVARRADYGFVDIVDASIGAAEERAMAAVRVVNLRVSYQADVCKRESEEFYTHHQDAQDDRAAVRAEIKKMPPKRNAATTTTTPMTDAQIKALVAQGVVDALAEIEANRSRNGDDIHDLGSDRRRRMPVACECTYSDFLKCQSRNFNGTEGDVGLTQWFERMESVFHISNCAVVNQVKYATCTLLGNALTWWNSHVKTVGHNTAYGMLYTQRFQGLALLCGRMFLEESDKVEKYVGGLPDMIQGSVMASKPKKMHDAIEFATELMDQKICTLPERVMLLIPTLSGVSLAMNVGFRGITRKTAQRTNPNSNVVTGKFLLNNRYALILFDTGADRSFVSTAFSSLIDIVPTTLDHGYDVELADGKIIKVNTLIRGCTLNFLNHPFNIDLMPVELGSFDVIIGMDWLTKYHVVIVCDEKLVRVPFGNEILIFRGDGSNNGHESRLNIISCTKTQKYLIKGCQVFLAHITAKKVEDKSEEKRLEDVPFVRDFPEVFPEDLQGIPPARQVEFQIDWYLVLHR
ncbi:putative reverse transcriptase domain-containing protein [Tanacetum coccineum]